jgi:hypothetical protein
MGDENMLLDFHETLLALQDQMSNSDKWIVDSTELLYAAVEYVFSETGDYHGYEVLEADLQQQINAAPGRFSSKCRDFLIPQLILKLMRKFKRSDRNNIRLDVVYILHDFLYHDGLGCRGGSYHRRPPRRHRRE